MALSILGIVAAIVLPKLLNVQGQSYTAVATQIASQLNETWAQWQDAGGQINSGTISFQGIVYPVLSSPSGTDFGNGYVADGGSSNLCRVTFPPDLTWTPPPSWNNSQVNPNLAFCSNYNIVIIFDGAHFMAGQVNLNQGGLVPMGTPGGAGTSHPAFADGSYAQWSNGGNGWTSSMPVNLGYGITVQFTPSSSNPLAEISPGVLYCTPQQTSFGFQNGYLYMAVYECGPRSIVWSIYRLPVVFSH